MTDFRALCAELADNLERYQCWYIEDNGYGISDLEALLRRASTALAQPEPQGPPKNCWLDDEPDLCPSPCVFDDPSEVIENCVYARTVKCKTDCKYYRTTQQPEPQGPTDEELESFLVDVACQNGNMYHAEPMTLARAVLIRWGRPAIKPVPVAKRLPGPEDCDAEGRCWLHHVTGLGLQEWHFLDRYPSAESYTFYGYTHWLPHHALPVPQQEGAND